METHRRLLGDSSVKLFKDQLFSVKTKAQNVQLSNTKVMANKHESPPNCCHCGLSVRQSVRPFVRLSVCPSLAVGAFQSTTTHLLEPARTARERHKSKTQAIRAVGRKEECVCVGGGGNSAKGTNNQPTQPPSHPATQPPSHPAAPGHSLFNAQQRCCYFLVMKYSK